MLDGTRRFSLGRLLSASSGCSRDSDLSTIGSTIRVPPAANHITSLSDKLPLDWRLERAHVGARVLYIDIRQRCDPA